MSEEQTQQVASKHFIQEIIEEDLANGKHTSIQTRFPPEPNGFLHIGHAKAICLSFGLAKQYGGKCNLRFDDTNPVKEEQKYIDSIIEDVRWMGFMWDKLCYASDYFEMLYNFALKLIDAGLAYVDDLSGEEMRAYRGNLTEPGRESPHRSRSREENRALFAAMRAGQFPDGAKVLRAKIDMAHPNINMRDPVLYRILKAEHHRTGNTWCIYPMYDYTHGQSDSIEGVTHSLCTLEFESHRPLYNWFIEQLGIFPSRQIEFARMNLNYTVMSKRKLLELVNNGLVSAWDDPRMPTISGLRRRGYTAASLRNFCEKIGIAKRENTIDLSLLEFCIREDLNKTAPRVMAVLDPLKVVITNYAEDVDEELDAVNNPEDPNAGTRKVPFSREIYIERDDFMEDPPKKYFRLAPGQEVRLRYAYLITCQEVIKDADGKIVELRCSYDPNTRGGNAPDGRKVKGTIHWVSASHAITADVRLYDRLFSVENPDKAEDGKTYLDYINPESLKTIQAKLEPSLAGKPAGWSCQFERTGYFCVDTDSTPDLPVFNRTVGLKDSWTKG